MYTTIIPFIFVLVISLIIGARFSKSVKGQSQYFLGDRSLGWGLLTMTFIATQIGGGFVLGGADAAFEIGPLAILFPLGYALGFLGLGLGFGDKLRALKLATFPEVFERFYQSPLLKRAASLLSIFSLTGILIAQAVALRSFLVSLGITQPAIYIFSWVMVIFYTTQGGFLAVVWTDTVQAAAMIGILFVTFFCAISQAENIPSISTSLYASWDLAQPRILGYILMPFLFTFIEQDMAQRCFAARSKRDISIAGILSAAFIVIMAVIPTAVGMVGQANGVVPGPASKFMEVIKLFKSPALFSAAATAVLLAIVSTASSLLSAVSSNVAQDFVSKLSLRTTRLITLVIGLFALACSFSTSNILSCMVVSYELSVACLLTPFVIAVFWKEKCASLLPAAIISVVGGGIGFLVTKMFITSTIGDLVPLLCGSVSYLVSACILNVRAKKKGEIQQA